MPQPIFEDFISEIDNEIRKRKGKWNLTALSWMDFDDVSQIIRIHIYRKWHLYDPARPLAPWVNTVISSQIKNLIRNNYGNYCRPCLHCPAAEGEDSCRLYVKQCSDCPIYKKWENGRKQAHDVKLPVSLENHAQEVFSKSGEGLDIEQAARNIHKKMEGLLKPAELRVYRLLYIDHKTEEEVAEQLGYKTNETGRTAGYKQIKNIKKAIIVKVKKALRNDEIDYN